MKIAIMIVSFSFGGSDSRAFGKPDISQICWQDLSL
jgi:hypothetical protein